MDFGVARERIRLRAVGEVIDVFRADDVDQRQVTGEGTMVIPR
jgi:hypothetical protein